MIARSSTLTFFHVCFLSMLLVPNQSTAQEQPRVTDRDAINPTFTQHTLISRPGETMPDLWQVLKFGGGVGPKLQLHALTGSSEYTHYCMQTATDRDAADPAVLERDDFMYDFNGDGTLDLIEVLKTSPGIRKVQLHVLSGVADRRTHNPYSTYLLQTDTDRDAGSPKQVESEHFMNDWNKDGKPDLVEVLKFGGGIGRKVQVHILSGAENSKYKSYLLQTATDRDARQAEKDGPAKSVVTDHEFFDWDGDGTADLIEFLKFGGGVGNKVEIHILSGASAFKKYILQSPLPIAAAKSAADALNMEVRATKSRYKKWVKDVIFNQRLGTFVGIASEQDVDRTIVACIKKAGTASNKVEIIFVGRLTPNK